MFPTAQIRRIAAELQCDPRSVESELNGRRVRGMVGERIRRYLAARRYIDSDPMAGTAMAVIDAEGRKERF